MPLEPVSLNAGRRIHHEDLSLIKNEKGSRDKNFNSDFIEVELTNEENPKPVPIAKPAIERQRHPSPCVKRNDLNNPTFADLVELASVRVLAVILESTSNSPPRLFPHSEYIRHTFFPNRTWDEHGDMETEFGRFTYMLSQHPERSAPAECAPVIQNLLASTNPLTQWPQCLDNLKECAERAKRKALRAMQPLGSGEEQPKKHKEDFWCNPASYPTSQKLSLRLWRASLATIALELEEGQMQNVGTFLQIHAFLKDPIGGLRPLPPNRISLFSTMWSHVQQVLLLQYPQIHLTTKDYRKLTAQLALESSYLSNPKLQKISYVHFSHHQQLCYVYTRINDLPRAEFSIPTRVLTILSETLLETSKAQSCIIAPITIAYAAPLNPTGRSLKVVIDGNNRLTAIVLLRFLATQTRSPTTTTLTDSILTNLDLYCHAHGLGQKWRIDLRDVLTSLLEDKSTLRLLQRYWSTVHAFFKNVNRVPALLVQEEDFFTLCLRRGTNEKPVLLQPMHQTFFNDESVGVAFRAKGGQAHGRTLGYKALPLRYEGGGLKPSKAE